MLDLLRETLADAVADPAVRTVVFGAAAVGGVGGAIGTFAVVRRQALQGDAVSHAALPGVAVAFLLGGRSEWAMVLGAAAAGWAAMALVGGVVRRSRVPFDAALAGALAVFFGLGLALMEYLRRHVRGAAGHGLERYLFGQAAFIRDDDVATVLAVGGAAVAVLALYWKEFKLVSFDPDFAASLGYPVRRLDLLLTTLVVAAVVVGLQTVGVVLMSTLIVAPAVAARQWTDRLGRVVLLAAAVGGLSGVGGTVLSLALSRAADAAVPPGPTIVLLATAVAVGSLLLSPRGGVRGRA